MIQDTYDKLHQAIYRDSGLTYGEIVEEFIALGNVIMSEDTDEFTWSSVGEFNECDLMSLLVAGYWHFVAWHAGQNSLSYAALCSLGQVYSPGMTSEPTPEDGEEYDCFNLLGEMAKKDQESRHE